VNQDRLYLESLGGYHKVNLARVWGSAVTDLPQIETPSRGFSTMRDPLADTPTLAEQLLAHLRAHQNEWRDRYHLQRIGLFGSTARNEATASSDVDVWVELDPLTPFATVHLKQELEELLQRPVDLVRLRERMNPALRQAILKEGVSA
jgi:predicted nucleotidyltransferase